MPMKRAIIAAVVLLVAGAALYFYLHAKQPPAAHYETAKITRGNITARVTATGTLSALVTVQVGSQVSGRIAQINVDFNSPVKKGQVDREDRSAAVRRGGRAGAKANVAAAEGKLAQAKANARNAELQRQRARRAARAEAGRAGRSRHRRGDRRRRRRQGADAGGAAGAGARAAASGADQPRLHHHHLAHRRRRHLAQRRRRPDGGRVAAGADAVHHRRGPDQDAGRHQRRRGRRRQAQAAAWRRPSPSTPIRPSASTGTVRQIRNAPQTVQNVVTYDAVIDVDNADLKLKPGMTANVTFVYAEKEDVLRVPNAALRFRPPPELLAPAKPASGGNGRDAGRAGTRRLRARRPRTVAPTPAAISGRSGCCAASARRR